LRNRTTRDNDIILNLMKKGIIIGAGIGGLTSAIALLKKGIDVRIYEQAGEMNEVGAGIWIAPNGMKVLEIRLLSSIRKIGNGTIRRRHQR
jgi:2-polyprenyl-6-methoxyphenol hydroxylase-like FAD-dependent oxidoreductase